MIWERDFDNLPYSLSVGKYDGIAEKYAETVYFFEKNVYNSKKEKRKGERVCGFGRN